MKPTDSTHIIQRFLKSNKQYWQIFFLVSILVYAVSFTYRLQMQTSFVPSRGQALLNWTSFFIALALALSIFNIKRKYFNLRYFRIYLESRHKAEPELDAAHLLRLFNREIGRKLKWVWVMGCTIVLLGVVYYWITFDAWNMHVYFIVGLYSQVINYPRRDLYGDVPYLLQEILQKNRTEDQGTPDSPTKKNA